MGLFCVAHRTLYDEHLFFEGPGDEDEGDLRFGCLWIVPTMLLLYGLLAWFVAILFRLVARLANNSIGQ